MPFFLFGALRVPWGGAEALRWLQELSAVLPIVKLCRAAAVIAVGAFQAVINGFHLIFTGLHVVAIISALLEATGTRFQDTTALAIADARALCARRAAAGTGRSPRASGAGGATGATGATSCLSATGDSQHRAKHNRAQDM
jgi:hypothetical protein